MKFKLILVLLIFYGFGVAQITPIRSSEEDRLNQLNQVNDSLLERNKDNKPSDSLKIYNPTIGDYNYWTTQLSKREIDTAMTIDSFYQQNAYEKDLFNYQAFPNIGQALNPLVPYTINDNLQLLPTGKSFMYLKEEDVKYYDVKTPLTEFILENGVKEGQYLSTTFAHNIHSRWNYTMRYRYVKSQGRYLNSLANNSNLVFSSNYQTKNNRYKIQGNFVTHDINNKENAGLTDESITDFIEDNPNFSNRERMYINLQNAETEFDERRINLEHQFGILSFSKNDTIADSLKTKVFPIYIKHQFNYKHQGFQYEEPSTETYYTSETLQDNRYNRKKLNKLENKVSLGYQWSDRLFVEGGIIQQNIKMYYDSAYVLETAAIPAEIKDTRIGVQGNMRFDWKENIHLRADGFFTQGDNFGSQYQLNANIELIPFPNYRLNGGVRLNSSFPSLNLLMNQSFYTDFNYYNASFDNETTQELYAELESKKLGLKIYGSLFNQTNMVYLDANYTPQQLDNTTNYFQIGAREHYKFGKIGIDAQAQFQKVTQNAAYLPLPDIMGRFTAYYETLAFKNHALFQTGITARYYSEFKSREFFPILNEFYITDDTTQQIGNYPQVDAFINLKVERMRIYLRGENLNSFLQPGEYFSTPLQPARDFKIQVGIHWFLFS